MSMLPKFAEVIASTSGSLRHYAQICGEEADFFRGANLNGVDLRGQDLRGMRFDGANFQCALMDRDTLIDPEFEGAILYAANVNVDVFDVDHFEETELSLLHRWFPHRKRFPTAQRILVRSAALHAALVDTDLARRLPRLETFSKNTNLRSKYTTIRIGLSRLELRLLERFKAEYARQSLLESLLIESIEDSAVNEAHFASYRIQVERAWLPVVGNATFTNVEAFIEHSTGAFGMMKSAKSP